MSMFVVPYNGRRQRSKSRFKISQYSNHDFWGSRYRYRYRDISPTMNHDIATFCALFDDAFTYCRRPREKEHRAGTWHWHAREQILRVGSKFCL